MRSPTSLHESRVYSPENFWSPVEKDFCNNIGTNQASQARSLMSASLIGHSGSSAFKLSTTAVSMSLTGSRFSSESAPRPFHHGIRRRGGAGDHLDFGEPKNPPYASRLHGRQGTLTRFGDASAPALSFVLSLSQNFTC